MDVSLESLLSIALGIGLAAAAGLRIFIPLLVAGLAARSGFLPLTDGFQWLAGTPALLRAKSGVMTAGLANPIVATVETVGASGLAILAITVPLLCLAAIAGFLYWATKKAGRLLFGRSRDNGAARP